MKKRLHDKKAGIALLTTLIVISVLEWIFRIACIGEDLVATPNAGEPIAIAIFSILIMIFTLTGKDRMSHVCFAVWVGYFILDQFFELPGMLANFAANVSNPVITVSIVIRLVTMLCIVAIGALLLEYMNDGTICNRAFNVLCVVTILLFTVDILLSASGLIFIPSEGSEIILLKKQNMLLIFNNIYRITMVFLFTFFAYDSAKHQLKKTNLTK
jgi:hypothetical protein